MRAVESRVRDSIPTSGSLLLIPALTLMVLCVLWITILFRLHTEKSTALRDTRTSANVLAQALQTQTLKTIHDIDEIALLVKFGYENAPQSFDLATYQARGLITGDTALQVTVVGANGHVLLSTLKRSGDVDLSDREHFVVHRQTPSIGLFISRPVVGRVSGRWSVQATRRIDRPDGSFGGIVVVSEDPAWLTDAFYNSAALGDHGLVSVLSRDGFRLSRRTGDAHSSTGGTAPARYLDLPRTGSDEVIDPLDHVDRIVAVRAIEKYGLVVVAGLSVDEALEDYVRMRNVYLIMAGLISLLLSGFAAWIMVLVAKLTRGREALRRLSEIDSLTGLPNRGRITDLLEQAAARRDAINGTALIFVDLDYFKELNDTHGHHTGDQILIEVGNRLRVAAGERAVAGRLGGDEFVVIVEASDAHAEAMRIAGSITAMLESGTTVSEDWCAIQASIGVAVLEQDETACDLLRKADLAMYEAKERRHTGTASAPGTNHPVARAARNTTGDRRRQYRDLSSTA